MLGKSWTPAALQSGTLLGGLVGCFYAVFTWAPNSGSLGLAWPGVFFWQVALMLPILWLLWLLWQRPLSAFRLGHGLDWAVALIVMGLVISSRFAQFPALALWYTWASLGWLAALYALTGWLHSPAQAQRLLVYQGILALGLIVLSLGFWCWQTLLPELHRLAALRQYGVDATFSFNSTSLRNWHPLGHQNYVAGYLLLTLPLLLGLGFTAQGWRRWLWWWGCGLGLVNLYTTSSRGGWLGLLGLLGVALVLALGRSSRPRWQIWSLAAGAGLGLMGVVALNDRLRGLVWAVLSGQPQGGELAYRWITNTVGWNMGIAHPWTGTGLGSVPLLYQAYRPAWAGREAELTYQLHSTPVHLWAELGLWGLVPPGLLGLMLLRLAWKWQQPTDRPHHLPPVLVWSLLGGLGAYGVMALTDHQLDIVAINGVLVLFVAILALEFRLTWPLPQPIPRGRGWHRALAVAGLGLLVAMVLWLIPIHRARAVSSTGFEALRQNDLPTFVEALTQAHHLAPWQPYYAYQLGWNLGELSYQTDDPQLRQQWLDAAIDWFQVANRINPDQEFGQSNVGWLLVANQDLPAAVRAFGTAGQLVPAKPGVFFGLGLSWLLQGQTTAAIDAFVLELLRHPIILTSPMWRQGALANLYPAVAAEFEQSLTQLLTQASGATDLERYLYQVRGAYYWWTGQFEAAAVDWAHISGDSVRLNDLVLATSEGEAVAPQRLEPLPQTPGLLALKAWHSDPAQRPVYLQQAWLSRPDGLPQLASTAPEAARMQQLITTMDQADTFLAWLHRAPSQEPRSRRLGFGVLSRHIDGPLPSDFLPMVENMPMVELFSPLLPSPIFLPQLDLALQPQRNQILERALSH